MGKPKVLRQEKDVALLPESSSKKHTKFGGDESEEASASVIECPKSSSHHPKHVVTASEPAGVVLDESVSRVDRVLYFLRPAFWVLRRLPNQL